MKYFDIFKNYFLWNNNFGQLYYPKQTHLVTIYINSYILIAFKA